MLNLISFAFENNEIVFIEPRISQGHLICNFSQYVICDFYNAIKRRKALEGRFGN